MKKRALLVLLALPLVAFDCGGKDEPKTPCPYACRLQVRGAVSDDLCCAVFAHDYSQDPVFDGSTTTNEWVFMLSGFRTNAYDEIASAGVFFDGRPSLGVPYGWDADVCSTSISWGSAERWEGSFFSPPYSTTLTQSADSALGTGALSLTFSELPPPTAVGEQQLGVHGTLTGTLDPEPDATGTVTFSATF